MGMVWLRGYIRGWVLLQEEGIVIKVLSVILRKDFRVDVYKSKLPPDAELFDLECFWGE